MYINNPKLVILVMINATIFFLLSVLHFYWAAGGTLWHDDVLPTSSNGMHRLDPSVTACIIVAIGLLVCCLITLGNIGMLSRYIARKYFRFATLGIACSLFIRAIGDFKFVGFFKVVKSTSFAANDTWIFSPLCLILALVSVLIVVFSRKYSIGQYQNKNINSVGVR